jgi:hypothetical protein
VGRTAAAGGGAGIGIDARVTTRGSGSGGSRGGGQRSRLGGFERSDALIDLVQVRGVGVDLHVFFEFFKRTVDVVLFLVTDAGVEQERRIRVSRVAGLEHLCRARVVPR